MNRKRKNLLIIIFTILFIGSSIYFGLYLFYEKGRAVLGANDEDGAGIVVYLDKDKSKSKQKAKEYKNVKKDYSDNGIIVVDATELSFVKNKKAKNEIVTYDFNHQFEVSVTPNDPLYAQQWALPKIDAPTTWDTDTGSNTITVAVLDTGFVLDHEDLTGRFVSGRDIIDSDNDPSLPPGGGTAITHATLVSGVIAGTANNSIGIVGLDWNVKIMPVRVMDNDGVGDTSTIAAGINYAFANGADIINMSLGGESGDSVLETAVNNAFSAGVTLVAASGNDGHLGVSYPAKYGNVIAVGSTDSSDVWASFSNYGPELDVVAPGVSIMTTATTWNGSAYTTSQYGGASGTSLSTPYVSALASLLLANDSLSPSQVRDRIISSADKTPGMDGENFHQEYGYGRINANKSLLGEDNNVADYSKISLNSFRIAMENTATPLNDNDYVLADYPAIGEPVSVRATLKNTNNFDVTLYNVRLIGVLDSGVHFVVGATSSVIIPANYYKLMPVASFNITSFKTHSFYIDYEVNGSKKYPYVKPTYSYQKIKAHFPNIRLTVGPRFSPTALSSYTRVIGAFRLKNYDYRPAYLRSSFIKANLGSSVYVFRESTPKINPGGTYTYESSIVPYKKGFYYSYPYIVYGNGYTSIPNTLSGVSALGIFQVY